MGDDDRGPSSTPAKELRASPLGDDLVVISYPIDPPASPQGLTPAEAEVLSGVYDGKSNREIATARGCAERTVANHLAKIYRKLGVNSRAELVAALHGHGHGHGHGP